jgi:hypothetical protein
MLRDNLVGLIEPMRISAGVDPLALSIQKQASDDRSSCLENPRPEGAESSLTETSPLHFRLSQHRSTPTETGKAYVKPIIVGINPAKRLWEYCYPAARHRDIGMVCG